MARKLKIERFNERVLSKYQIYNNLFLTLPFKDITKTGILLPLFSSFCETAFKEGKNPFETVDTFFQRYTPGLSLTERYNLLFNFIQFIERQVVLFDAIEDAAFSYIHNMDGIGTIRYIQEQAAKNNKESSLKDYLERFKVRIVLTAHPTQFYPDSVLVIINELSKAIATDDLENIKLLMAQLGSTPFYTKDKPTPFEEAVSLIWYLENVFYHATATIHNYLGKHVFGAKPLNNPIFNFGFWPGGDRDGNPYVTAETTLKTAARLRFSILRNYYRDLRILKRKITFPHVAEKIKHLEETVFNVLFYPSQTSNFSLPALKGELDDVLRIVNEKYHGLYQEAIVELLNKINLFGFHFATLDLRQDSRVHHQVFLEIIAHPEIHQHVNGIPANYKSLDTEARCSLLTQIQGNLNPKLFQEGITRQTLESIKAMQKIQTENGEPGCNRYIISNCQSLENILELYAIIRLCGWETPTLDIIPLFETIADLEVAPSVMQTLYENSVYANHLAQRGNKQTIMLGFSDGTKDGGYFMANWSIFKAKEALSAIASTHGISIAFFDGRGGPPARGGGNTHEFYAAMGDAIQSDEIQLTVQGQTISSKFGTHDTAQYNLEQLLSSGIANELFAQTENEFTQKDRETLDILAAKSYEVYREFKAHPKFLPYLTQMSTLPYYAKTNIGSRPAKRGSSNALNFSDLRAIPFVGSWSMLKQNVPGFYGVGTAIQYLKDRGELDRVKILYKHSPFFRTLVFNSMMSMTKSFFQLTAYMAEDKEFGSFWNLIYKEFQCAKTMLLEISGFETLMQNEPTGKASIQFRDQIVLPLLTIQQYALMQIQYLKSKGEYDEKLLPVLEKMIIRSLFGNINASRNSA